MNIVLFEQDELARPLPLDDRRARHVLQVLRRQPGDCFDAGVIDGPLGKARLVAVQAGALHLAFEWTAEPPPLEPLTLLVGLPRPQAARRILQEATALGVAHIYLPRTDRGEASYAASTLWSSGEWRRHLVLGAEQAFSTRLPRVEWGRLLPEVLAGLDQGDLRLALDNYEAGCSLGSLTISGPATLAVGPERGWSGAERDLLRRCGFQLVHLGRRVLRVETACIAAVALVRAGQGSM